MCITIKRIYEKYSPDDGFRILVDRVWPRGVAKEDAALYMWLKDAAPSTELRKWFNHDKDKFQEFRNFYEEELAFGESRREAVKLLILLSDKGNVTLLYGARDPIINHAVILKEWVEKEINTKSSYY